jgi:Tfp pilus assembly protein PilO
MEPLIKNLHYIILAYVGMNLFFAYEEHTEQVDQKTAYLTSIQAKRDKLKIKLNKIDKFKKNLAASEQRVQEVLGQIEKLQKQLPSDSNDAVVQNMLGSKGKELMMRNPKPEPGDEKNNGFYLSREYTFKAKSTFLQFLIFMENVGKSERILNVTNLSLKHSEDPDRSSQQILDVFTTIESYRYNKDFKESKDG